mmetsp:Transcript_80916/g.158105  ORF Transcript_80916/g.158105 Transcript_80916/m.158105 type:complete len:491 (+) Transcript_80916:26-1498(+)
MSARPSIDHLTGCRFLASLWIVCNHFVPRGPTSLLEASLSRSNVAVSFFITMSGFITHWAYSDRVLDGDRASVARRNQYYVRRLGRVLTTTWVAMILGLVVMMIWEPGSVGNPSHVVRCFCFIETWFHPQDWCPNGQTWTIAALLPSWLLYPWSKKIVAGVESRFGGSGLVLSMLLLWVLEFGSIMGVFLAQGFYLTADQHYQTYTWPASQLVDFLIGCFAAALAKQHLKAFQQRLGDQAAGTRVPENAALAVELSDNAPVGQRDAPSPRHVLLAYSSCGVAADHGFISVVALCFLVPSGAYRQGYEPLYNHGLVPAFVLFLWGGAVQATTDNHTATGPFQPQRRRCYSSIAVRCLRHPILLALGACSFEVFLFQWPVHFVVTSLLGDSGSASSEVFVLFLLVLWSFSAWYIAVVEAPLVKWLRKSSEHWGAPEVETRVPCEEASSLIAISGQRSHCHRDAVPLPTAAYGTRHIETPEPKFSSASVADCM